jgi:hypothetical protein
MTGRQQRMRAFVLASIMSLALFVTGPALAIAHAEHRSEDGVDMVTTLQVAGVVALLGVGYLVISRQGSRRESDRR